MTPKVKRWTWRGYPIVPLIFSFLGLVLLVNSIVTTNFKLIIWAAFLFLAFLAPLLDAAPEYIKLRILHRLSLFALGVVAFYVFSLTFSGVLMFLLGVAALADIIYSVILKPPSDPR